MPMFEHVFEIVIRIVTSQVVESVIERAINTANFLSFRPVASHYRTVKRKLVNMPFIYRNLRLDIISDFVRVDRTTLDYDSLAAAHPQRVDIGTDGRIKSRARALFLGNAGMGKTTLFRHTILTLINNHGFSPLFEDHERLVPLYVPLKALDNTREYPIMRYLLENNPVLIGRNGIAQLTTLAQRRQVFLLLDGYDEVPNPAGLEISQTPFFSELQVINYHQHRLPHQPICGGPYGPFYQALTNCRVWMSSRYDFYRMNRVPLFERSHPPKPGQAVVAVGLTGMGHNRPQLVNNIFNRYRSTNEKYEESLNEERFLANIDSLDDVEVSELSFNPLFLTIMCYIYVNEVIDPMIEARTWARSVPVLILQCVKLLVRDLDEDKARDLPPRQREGMRLRRGRYKAEMEAFLLYFASQLIADGQSVFDVDYLRSKLRCYFTEQSDSPNSSLILKSLANGPPSSDVARQLIWCGVFIVVDNEPLTYDFPHRRFREVLATKYFEDHPRRLELIDAYIDSAHFELVYVLYVYMTSTIRLEILKCLLRRTLDTSDTRFGSAAFSCVSKTPTDHTYKATLIDFISQCIRNDRVFFWPKDLLRLLAGDQTLVSCTRLGLRKAVEGDKRRSIEVCLAIIDGFERAGHGTVHDLLVNYCALGRGRILVLRQGTLSGEVDGEVILPIMSDATASIELLSVLMAEQMSGDNATKVVRKLMPLMSPGQFAFFWSKVVRRKARLAEDIRKAGCISEDLQVIATLVDYYNGDPERGMLASGCYVLRQEVIDRFSGGRPSSAPFFKTTIFLADTDLAIRLENISADEKAKILSRCYLGPAICSLVWEAVWAAAVDVPPAKSVFFGIEG